LNISPHYGSIIFDSVVGSVSPNARGSMNAFFVKVLMTDFALGEYSNCHTVSREEPSPIYASFNFSSLDERLVVSFLGGIFSSSASLTWF
jgi:hypothetical protein